MEERKASGFAVSFDVYRDLVLDQSPFFNFWTILVHYPYLANKIDL